MEPLPDIHPPQDSDIDSEIGSIIVIGDGNGFGDDKIDKIDPDEPEDNSDCNGEPGDYPIPQLMEGQANSEVLSELSPAAIIGASTEP